MITVSVIIPNYNHARFLEERIKSVLNQTYTSFEIILLDDASTDSSIDILDKYRSHPNISHIQINDINSGSPFSQWSKGLSLAKGKWIWIAESDDIADPLFLETALHRLDQQPGASLFYCDAYNKREDDQPLTFVKYSEARKRIFDTDIWKEDYAESGIAEINQYLKFACTINNISSVVFRKTILADELEDTGHYRFHGDWYYLLKICARGDVLYSAKALNSFRMKADSLLTGEDAIRSKTEYFRILDWLLKQPYVSNKEALLDFFILQYTGYGFLSDGFRHGKRIFSNYKQINPVLAKQMYRRMIRLKFSGKKRKKLF